MSPRSRFFKALAAAIFSGSVATAATPVVDAASQREQQKKVQAEVDKATRHVMTTLEVLNDQQVDSATERKLLDEAAGMLRNLSQDQIVSVLSHLEASISAPDAATAQKEQKEAYDKHRKIVTSLRGLVIRLDTIKSLEDAANRFSKSAEAQHELHLKSLTNSKLPRNRRPARVSDDRDEIADTQADMKSEVIAVAKGLDSLRTVLAPDLKQRLEQVGAVARGQKLGSEMELTARSAQQGTFEDAAERQIRHAKELQALAAELRAKVDRLTALKDARTKIAKTVEAQEAVNKETAEKPREKENRGRNGSDPAQVHADQAADKQSKVEFATNEIRRTLETVDKDLADTLKPAQNQMSTAEEKLRETKTDEARQPQAKAVEELKKSLQNIDEQIAKAELAKTDPAEALKQAAKQIDELIKEQKQVAEKTKQDPKDEERVREAAQEQKDVAAKTEQVKALQLPENKEAKKSLEQATQEMKQAAKNLDNKDAQAAKPQQDEAVKALENAKKSLEEQAAAIEQRREDIAALKDAAEKLEALAKAEQKVADNAKDASEKPMKPEGGEKKPEPNAAENKPDASEKKPEAAIGD